ncbi:MAG TPA: hypothetical protein VF121_03060 [Thermoanaerobaculia bacterium]|nr:hypothetical protein [Thermoanaerobaculia bacterium]
MKRSRLLLLATPFLPLLVALPGGRWLFPLVAPLALYPAFRERVVARDWRAAWGLAMLWAFLLSAGVVILTLARPEVAAAGILNGEPYREEMFGWIATGEGREADWRAFLPQHLLHLAAFLLLTYVSGGYLGLALGAALVAYMSYFVGSYAAASGAPLLGALAAWVPWSVVRVAAFVLLGCLLARPLLVRRPWPFDRREARLFALAGAGILADVLLKALLARPYGRFLRELARGILLGG